MFINVTDSEAHRIRINVNNIAYYHEYGRSRTIDLKSELVFITVASEDAHRLIHTMESPKEIDTLIAEALGK